MAKVTFLGVTGQSIETIELDDLVLKKGGDPQDVTADQLEQLRAFPGARFSDDSKPTGKGAKPAGGDEESGGEGK